MMSSITAQEETLDLKNQDRVLKSKHNNLELGLMAGAMVYTGDAHCEKFLLKNGLSPAGGAFLRYYLTDRWSLRGNFLGGKIKGDDKNYPGKEHGDRNFKFTSNILDFNGTLNFEPWGHKRYSSGTFRKIFSPYLNIGAGFVYSNPKTDYNEANNRNLAPQIAADKADIKKMNFSVPFGIGWRYDFSEKLTIGAEASYRVPFTDYLDGISKSGNPKAKDWYETGTVNIAYRLKYKRDMDKDGIADEDDACPTERGTLRGKGCPDQDGDGVVDKMDSCPTEQGSPALNGCPDKDSDGIADRDDACPDYPGDAMNSGCPDKDGDGIIDMKDDCPTVKGLVAFGGCPDTDGDGISDKLDNCPTERGTTLDNGCPPTDMDKDGIADREDKCPDQAGTLANNGCPEIKKEIISSVSTTSTTSSTITSNVSVSPDAVVVGTFTDYSSVENLSVGSTYKGNGVEVDPRQLITNTVNVSSETTTTISSEETSIFEEALYGIQFETGSAVITNTSFNILNKVYNVMRNRSAVNYEIGGHTDNQGNSIANQRLSEARAKAVYNFLVKKGISASRLSFVGYGDTNPVADNGSAAGRSKNRRVQFSIR
jgi:outer membrane protein OmpA-like peptidoglycan-associated protein/opacity protein-like surface antigen